jgi:mannose-6-phosphate isomerase-like protein (cupin superfamily)
MQDNQFQIRPWGRWEVLQTGNRFKVKRLLVEPGQKLSLQQHLHRSEHWVVVQGTASVKIADTTQYLTEDQSIYVPDGSIHQLGNPGLILLEVIEVQIGSYLEEDDIIRYPE